MEWDELIKGINHEWNKNKKNAKLKFNGIYKLIEQMQPDNNNLLQALKSECRSELEVAKALDFLVAILALAFGILTIFLSYALTTKDIMSFTVYGLLIIFALIIILLCAFKILKGAKQAKFVLCVIETFESDLNRNCN